MGFQGVNISPLVQDAWNQGLESYTFLREVSVTQGWAEDKILT